MHSGWPRRPEHEWLDDDAGPVVRPYAVTGGRVRSDAGAGLDLVAYIEANVGSDLPAPWLQPEHRRILDLTQTPLTVAEVSSHLGLALGVVRVLLGDLIQQRLVSVHQVSTVTPNSNEQVLKEVIDGLRAL
jgi:hypothetical protein